MQRFSSGGSDPIANAEQESGHTSGHTLSDKSSFSLLNPDRIESSGALELIRELAAFDANSHT